MKKIIGLAPLLVGLLLHAQETKLSKSDLEEPVKKMSYQVGLNATSFIKQFVVPNNTATTNQSPYDFIAKALYHTNNTWAYGLRTGFGYTNTRDANFSMTSNTESTSENVANKLRVGIEIQQALSYRWVVYYGLDYIWAKETNTTVSKFSNGFPPNSTTKTITTDFMHTTGAGPVLGIQFNINPHICLSTEMSLYLTTFNGSSVTNSYPSNPSTPVTNPVSQSLNNGRKSNLIAPTFINFNFIF